MNSAEFEIEYSASQGNTLNARVLTPVRVVTPDGGIFEIASVNFSAVNGGAIHIVAEEYDD